MLFVEKHSIFYATGEEPKLPRNDIQKQGRILMLPVDCIEPSPYQARTAFDEPEIAALAVSILQNGLLQPISVRRVGLHKYQLGAGERRLRACRLAKLDKVPAILADYDDSESAALGLLENLQRSQLDPFDTARGIKEVIRLWGCTQAEAARRLGLSQPALANKLRLLRLEEPVAEALHHYGLTERHARALLRLEDPEQRLAAVEHIGKNQLNVADAEAYIDRLVAQNQTTQPRRRSTYILKDVRLFLNSVDRGVRLMQTAGVGAKVSRRDTEDAICLTVTIPRAKPQKDVS